MMCSFTHAQGITRAVPRVWRGRYGPVALLMMIGCLAYPLPMDMMRVSLLYCYAGCSFREII
ncbi:Uncharacterised protein [Bartonella grahamii]|uniref:Uncharacterized protein n=1 Tax=Bartonella grahamii TaxID=33045 RepID=A0A336NJL3_BARGR|nr:Uncharacterised protein [Bartonella grahamii]